MMMTASGPTTLDEVGRGELNTLTRGKDLRGLRDEMRNLVFSRPGYLNGVTDVAYELLGESNHARVYRMTLKRRGGSKVIVGKEFFSVSPTSGGRYRQERNPVTLHADEARATGVIYNNVGRYDGKKLVPKPIASSTRHLFLFLQYIEGPDSRSRLLRSLGDDAERKDIIVGDLERIAAFGGLVDSHGNLFRQEGVPGPAYSKQVRSENLLDDLCVILDHAYRRDKRTSEEEPYNPESVVRKTEELLGVDLRREISEIVDLQMAVETYFSLQHGDMKPRHIRDKFIDLEKFGRLVVGADVARYMTAEGGISMLPIEEIPNILHHFFVHYGVNLEHSGNSTSRKHAVQKLRDMGRARIQRMKTKIDLSVVGPQVVSQLLHSDLHTDATNKRGLLDGPENLLRYGAGLPEDWWTPESAVTARLERIGGYFPLVGSWRATPDSSVVKKYFSKMQDLFDRLELVAKKS